MGAEEDKLDRVVGQCLRWKIWAVRLESTVLMLREENSIGDRGLQVVVKKRGRDRGYLCCGFGVHRLYGIKARMDDRRCRR